MDEVNSKTELCLKLQSVFRRSPYFVYLKPTENGWHYRYYVETKDDDEWCSFLIRYLSGNEGTKFPLGFSKACSDAWNDLQKRGFSLEGVQTKLQSAFDRIY